MSTEPNPFTLYDVPQVAEFLHITERTARELFNRRRFPIVKLGRRIFVRHTDLIGYLDAQTQPASRTAGER